MSIVIPSPVATSESPITRLNVAARALRERAMRVGHGPLVRAVLISDTASSAAMWLALVVGFAVVSTRVALSELGGMDVHVEPVGGLWHLIITGAESVMPEGDVHAPVGTLRALAHEQLASKGVVSVIVGAHAITVDAWELLAAISHLSEETMLVGRIVGSQESLKRWLRFRAVTGPLGDLIALPEAHAEKPPQTQLTLPATEAKAPLVGATLARTAPAFHHVARRAEVRS